MRTGRTSPAFSLMELLAVLAIFAVLATLAVPSIQSIRRSLELQSAASDCFELLGVARQTARTLNRPVEVRFYRHGEVDVIRVFPIQQNGAAGTQLQKALALPATTVISTNAVWSSLLTDAAIGAAQSDSFGSYRGFRFHPNGSTSILGSADPTVTILSRVDGASSSLPANFFTLQIGIDNGVVKTYRPR